MGVVPVVRKESIGYGDIVDSVFHNLIGDHCAHGDLEKGNKVVGIRGQRRRQHNVQLLPEWLDAPAPGSSFVQTAKGRPIGEALQLRAIRHWLLDDDCHGR